MQLGNSLLPNCCTLPEGAPLADELTELGGVVGESSDVIAQPRQILPDLRLQLRALGELLASCAVSRAILSANGSPSSSCSAAPT